MLGRKEAAAGCDECRLQGKACSALPQGDIHTQLPFPGQTLPVPGNRNGYFASRQSQTEPVGGGTELCWCHCLTSPEISSIRCCCCCGRTSPTPEPQSHCSISHLPVYSQIAQGPPRTGIPPRILHSRDFSIPPSCTPHHRDPPTPTGSLSMSVPPDRDPSNP